MVVFKKVITVFQVIGKKVQPFCLSLLRKGSLDVVFMLILNHAVGVSGIAWATPIADWIAFVISVALIVPQLRQLKAEAQIRKNRHLLLRQVPISVTLYALEFLA